MTSDNVKSIIEALLFAGSEPLKPGDIREALAGAVDLTDGSIGKMIDELREEYRRESRSFTIGGVAGGYRLQTLPEYGEWIARLRASPQRRKLSAPAMETLAIVAYRQPITRAEVEAIRGVNIDGVLENLIDRELVEPRGRKQAVGKPHLFGTTKKFLEHFGLQSLKDLPQIEELRRTAEKQAPREREEKEGAPAQENAAGVESPRERKAEAGGGDAPVQEERKPLT